MNGRRERRTERDGRCVVGADGKCERMREERRTDGWEEKRGEGVLYISPSVSGADSSLIRGSRRERWYERRKRCERSDGRCFTRSAE